MSESQVLIETLRRYLKVKGMTYRELASKMGQTEANMKRIFSQRTLSLIQLEKMCHVAGTDLFELIRMSSHRATEIGVFTDSQEAVLAASPKMFALFYLLLSNLPVDKILKKYTFTTAETQKFLLKLDKLGLIRLMEDNRVQVLVSKNIRWLENGPLNKMYRDQITKEFLDVPFSGPNERLRFLNAPMSHETQLVVARRVDKLINEFLELAELERGTPSEKNVSLCFVVAYRPWAFSVVNKYLR